MAYKLAVSDTVSVPVKFSQADGGKLKQFSFTLFIERQGETEFEEGCKGEHGVPTNAKVCEKMLSLTTGWKGQEFILNDDGTPAEFCQEALAMMYNAVGVLDVVVKSYMKENGARTKNS